MKIFSYILLDALMLGMASLAYAEGEKFEPMTKELLDKFYSAPERSVTVTVYESKKLHTVPNGFLGINLSYFNITDEIWKKYDLLSKLRKSGIKSLRYPGGKETSFFHWEHPGVNGYEDIWDPNGVDPKRSKFRKFQATWVAPKQWNTNKNFMNFDEFMQACKKLGAEPIVGINLTSGRKHNRIKDGIEEALRWLRYCRKKGYKVTYWFLDNETWNWESPYVFKDTEYAEDVIAYGTAIKKEFPNVKLIVNPTSNKSYNYREGLEQFISKTAAVIDYIDVHWYWAWGQASFDLWIKQTLLDTGDKWKDPEISRPFGEDIALIKESCKKAGAPHVGLVVLEWNIAPSDWSQTFNQSLIAIIQAELLMEFARGDVHLTCLWPLIWRTSRDVWSEQDFFPSIVTQDPPFEQTLSLDMFRLFSPVQGKIILASESSSKDLRVLAAENERGQKHLMFISKNALRRKITVNFDKKICGKVSAEMIGLKHQVVRPQLIDSVEGNRITFYAEPYSFTAIDIQ
jgi:hypothetical protein